MNRRANLSLFNAFLRIGYPLRPSPTATPTFPFFAPATIPTSKSRFSPTMVATHFAARHNPRSYSDGGGGGGGGGGGSSDLDHNKEVDAINLKFAEAREEIETALESKDSVYFDEEAECARAAVNEVVGMFDGLLARLPERERGALQRSMGLKIEQLKAELRQLDE